jgi:adenylate cyclase
VVEALGTDTEFRWRVAAPRRFKGIRGAQRLYRVTGA